MRKLAREEGVSDYTVRKIVKENLHMQSYKIRERHLISDATKQKRMERCQKLLNRLKAGTLVSPVFCDEKIFTVEAVRNQQNDRFLSPGPSSCVPSVSRCQHPASVMVWAAVSKEGKSPLVFVSPGAKVNTTYYVDCILKQGLLPWAKALYGRKAWTFVQDGAPSHTSKITQKFCLDNFPAFLTKLDWPPSSPDLNPLDYCLWSVLEEKACRDPHPNLEALKRSLTKVWEEIPQKTVRAAVNAFRGRVEGVIQEDGGHIE
jgi:hypothetical protein